MASVTRDLPDAGAPAPAWPDAAARLPQAPSAVMLWTRALIVASVVVGLFLLDRLSLMLLNYWLLDSMGYASVFWTNFRMSALLFAGGVLAFLAVTAVPAALHGLSRRGMLLTAWIGGLGGLVLGWELSGEYLEFLGSIAAVSFDRTDPVFGNDLAFYVFDLPPLITTLQMLLLVLLIGLVASVATALVGSRGRVRPDGMSALVFCMGRIATPFTLALLVATGLVGATLIWLGRYGLLIGRNFEDQTEGMGAGADYLDLVGLFSTKNSIYVEAVALLALTVGLTLMLRTARRALDHPGSVDLARSFGPAAFALVLLPGVTADLLFRAAVSIRNEVAVVPNEPVIQLPYLQRHIDATLAAYGLDGLDEQTFVPKSGDDPLPPLATFLDHPAVKNAPLWPGSVARYGRRVGPQYVQRILAAEGDMTVYAPTLEIFQAQQKLRPYYEFLDVDTIVIEADGEPRMMASAVRELPLDVIRPWLATWGQRSFLFTHGNGLVTVETAGRTATGEPVYGTRDIPTKARFQSLEVGEEAIVYGEGSTRTVFSDAVGILEHDMPTDQGRLEVAHASEKGGVVVDSLLKRLVIAYQSDAFLNVLFSGLIGDTTRAHVYRRPLERIGQVAPFLKLDTDPYAVPAQDELVWMVNALTFSNAYPYSAVALLGDNADLRTEMRPLEPINYAADSVKAVVSAATGQVTLYRISDEPVIRTWAGMYPGLFQPASAMPADIRAQMQYPQALMSIQFNKIYPYYHQRDALTFFSGEDLLDDADEVVGPLRGMSGAITFSQGLYNWMAKPGGVMPESSAPVQFALTKNYTPQDALNLRGLATVYQTGEDYGRLSVLKVPKGRFFPGPEQIDSIIDQDAFIAQQISLWNRLDVEVIRGNTTLLVVEGEALYVEPIFIRSRQNPVPQLQRVVVVLRGEAHMGRDMEEALTFAVRGGRLEPEVVPAPPPPPVTPEEVAVEEKGALPEGG